MFSRSSGARFAQLFHRFDSGGLKLLHQAGRQSGNRVQRRRNLLLHAIHLAFDFGALFFFALDIDAPADQLRRQPDVLSLLADGQRQLAVFDHHLHDLVRAVDDRHTADLGRADGIGRESHDVVVPLNDVDLLAAQFADDRLHARALHADAGADRIDVLFARRHGDLGSLSGFARNAS